MTTSTITTSNSMQGKEQPPAGTAPVRLLNTTVCVPVVYGSMAFPLKKPDANNNTHQWTLYLRGPNNEDLSAGIAKVVFQLHPSFAQPVRELTAPPFEVTEKGWGEFEASIRIVWRDVGEKAMVLTHTIKLYPPLPPNQLPDPIKETGPVKNEKYDEIVFTDPTELFHQQLMDSRHLPKVQSNEADVQAKFEPYSDDDDIKTLMEAQKFLESQLQNVKDRILRADASLLELDEALVAVANKNKPAVMKSHAPPQPTNTSATAIANNAPSTSTSSTGTKRKSSSKSGGSSKRNKSQ